MNDFDFIEPTPAATPSGHSSWEIIHVKARIDAFTLHDLIKEIGALREKGHKRIAIDLKNNRFMSFNAIRFLSDAAREIGSQDGSFVLIACAEKTKRHFEIYGSLAHIRIIRTELEL